jgi:hypothetical protein
VAIRLSSLLAIRLNSQLAIRRKVAIRLNSLVATRPSHHPPGDIRRSRTDLRARRLAALAPKVRRPRRVQ